ncbi:MAG: hypothetical protein NTX50_29490 [Candidatus Sumerlaeota bacterium]|nr:hypothetical protein [Candidatus Sumerlaeota bacterium]
MKTVAKILIDFEAPDSIAARVKLRELANAILPVLPKDGHVREFKITEDGTGRLIEKIELSAVKR